MSHGPSTPPASADVGREELEVALRELDVVLQPLSDVPELDVLRASVEPADVAGSELVEPVLVDAVTPVLADGPLPELEECAAAVPDEFWSPPGDVLSPQAMATRAKSEEGRIRASSRRR